MPVLDENAEHMAASHALWEQLRGSGAGRQWNAPWEVQRSSSYSPFSDSPGRPPPSRPDPPPPNPEPPKVAEVKPEPVKEKKVRGLFKVYIVDPELDTILFSKEIIAADDSAAKMRAALKAGLDEELTGKDIDAYDIIVVRLGNVRDKSEIKAELLQSAMLAAMNRSAESLRHTPQIAAAVEKATSKK